MEESTVTSVDFAEYIRVSELSFTFGKDEGESAEHKIQDVLTEMLKRDSSLVLIRGTSPQLQVRKHILDWMKIVTRKRHLLKKTLFLGVYLYDRFTDRHDIALQQIHLVALSCLRIAAKLEENEGTVPKMKSMSRLLPVEAEYSVKLYLAIEKLILQFFKFRVLFPTILDIFEYFVLFAIECTEIQEQNDLNNNLQQKAITAEVTYFDAFTSIQETSNNFMYQIILEHPESGKYRPSLLAATAIMMSRLASGFCAWSGKLEKVTTYAESAVTDCMVKFLPEAMEGIRERNFTRAKLTEIENMFKLFAS